MYPLTHLTVPLLFSEIPGIKNRYKINRLALIIGSLLPDIIDKSIHLITNISGIMYCHNLLFVFLSFLLLHIITNGKKQISVPFLVGSLIHLLLDLPNIPIFSPFITYEYQIIDNPIEYYSGKYLKSWLIIITESVSGIVLTSIFIQNKLFQRKKLREYLCPKPQIYIDDKNRQKDNKIKVNNL